VTSQRRTYLVVAATLAIAGLVGLPSRILAQQNNRNETGLPLYPHVTTGSQYPAMQTKGRWYTIYTAQSSDSLADVEAWYRHALPQAKETKDENQLTHGSVLTNRNDKVLVYRLGKRGDGDRAPEIRARLGRKGIAIRGPRTSPRPSVSAASRQPRPFSLDDTSGWRQNPRVVRHRRISVSFGLNASFSHTTHGRGV
jgi:hypothetical protein